MIKDTLDGIGQVFQFFMAYGWDPIALAASFVVMLGLRLTFEPNALKINDEKEMSTAGWIKLAIFVGVLFFTALIQFGRSKPGTGFDRALCLGFSGVDVIFSYVITSSQKFKGIWKGQFFKGADNATPPTA